jgi:hypothetical protein
MDETSCGYRSPDQGGSVMRAQESEFEYSSRRSEEEAILAINAESEAAAAAHRRMARLFSMRALLSLDDGAPPARPHVAIAPEPRTMHRRSAVGG